ncbi:MAG: hypothetical protein MJZ69_04160 [Bacteroidaceae bacterium]|nr:zinc-ribbon domain-containing protein [Candidatus Minthousia equi]MCQ2245968.1 hypothetical protein [Bacteroidaceae bacterium]MDO4956984.1 hypothetical protein [Bacteroidales bacterium]
METDNKKDVAQPEEKPATQKSNARTYHCNDCGATIYKHEVFCSKCGKKLDYYDFED